MQVDASSYSARMTHDNHMKKDFNDTKTSNLIIANNMDLKVPFKIKQNIIVYECKNNVVY